MEPQEAAEQVTVQLTPLFDGSLETVAVNCVIAPASTVALPGATETTIPGMVMNA